MIPSRTAPSILLAAFLCAGALLSPAALAQKPEAPSTPLPPELRGAKVYNLPEDTTPGTPAEDPVIYKDLTYEAIDLEKLTLNLFLSVRPVDRAATVRRVVFQDIRANGVPIRIESFDQEFKLSKKETVDLPGPLKCAIVFSELDSLKPVKDVVEQDKIRISGQSFIEVKLNAVEKVALRARRLVLPVQLNEEVPLQMFSGNPILKMAATKILDTLADPSTSAAIVLAKEHLARLSTSRSLAATGKNSIYLIYCEYSVRDPKTAITEKFSEIGTGFLASADGKLVTAKRVVQPWKFNPQVAALLEGSHLELDPKGYRIWAWPAGAQELSADGQPDPKTALTTDNQTLRALTSAPDRMETVNYQDAEIGTAIQLSLHAPGENDAAVLQLTGADFHPLTLAEQKTELSPDVKLALLGFPFGLSQSPADFRLVFVKAEKNGSLISLDHQINPGESGAPLITPDGKVVGFAGGSNQCVPIEAIRALVQ